MGVAWERRCYDEGQGTHAAGHHFRFVRRTEHPDVKLWVERADDGTYLVSRSKHLGNYKFETEVLKEAFRSAADARLWADLWADTYR
ncbi:MAG: hypothetical protein KGL39_20790 [Patescibacteria group bacterium]|nr:hypothetical protein [Patescibacteria group bacterium]